MDHGVFGAIYRRQKFYMVRARYMLHPQPLHDIMTWSLIALIGCDYIYQTFIGMKHTDGDNVTLFIEEAVKQCRLCRRSLVNVCCRDPFLTRMGI